MSDFHQQIDDAIEQVKKLRELLKKGGSRQVSAFDDKSIIKATALSWFKNTRPVIENTVTGSLLNPIDALYNDLLASSERSIMRSKYIDQLRILRQMLIELRSTSLTRNHQHIEPSNTSPDFSKLIPDPQMQSILERRWAECVKCATSGAPMAATVMTGGLLEALLLARVLRETDKTQIFLTTAAPKDKTSGKPLPFQEWGLGNFIQVAHEMGWISQTVRDVSEVLQEYRNYIHPYKERSHGVVLNSNDAQVLWDVGKSITIQILQSVKP